MAEARRGVPEKLLRCYWDLASSDRKLRIAAVLSLIKELENASKSAVDGRSPQIDYSVKRLVRGLSSSRAGARQGFSTALCELLRARSLKVDAEEVYSLLLKSFEEATHTSKSEEKEHLFGLVFGLLAVIKSGRCPSSLYSPISEELKKLAQKRKFLRLLAHEGLSECVSDSKEEVLTSIKQYIGPLTDTHLDEIEPDTLYLALCIERLSGQAKLLGENSLKHLSAAFRASSYVHPEVHPIWPLLLDRCIKDKQGDFSTVWRYGVEESLLDSSVERKYLAFILACSVIDSNDGPSIEVVFKKKFLRCLSHVFTGSSNHPLRDAAKSVVSRLLEYLRGSQSSAGRDDASCLRIVASWQEHCPDFDKASGMRFIAESLSILKPDTISEFLLNMEKEVDNALQRGAGVLPALDRLCSICKQHKKLSVSLQRLQECVRFVTRIVFNEVKESSAQGSEKQALEERFFGLLGDMGVLFPTDSSSTSTVMDTVWEQLISMKEAHSWKCVGRAQDTIKALNKSADVETFAKKEHEALRQLVMSAAVNYLLSGEQHDEVLFDDIVAAVDKILKGGDDAKDSWNVIFDVAFALCSFPRAFYRELARYGVSCLAERATKTTVDDLCSSLTSKDGEEGEESVSDEDTSNEESAESDDDEDNAGAESEEEEVAEEKAKEITEQSQPSAGSEDESVDMDAVDPAELKRYDTQLGRAFESMKREKARAQQEKNTLAQFRHKAVELLETLGTRNVALVPAIAKSAVSLMASNSPIEAAVADRLRGVLRKKLLRTKKPQEISSSMKEDLKGLMSTLFSAKVSRRSDMRTLVVEGMAICLRWLWPSVDEVIQELRSALKSFMTVKNTPYHLSLFESVAQRHPLAFCPLVRDTVFFAEHGRSHYLRSAAFQLLGELFKQKKVLSQYSDVLGLAEDVKQLEKPLKMLLSELGSLPAKRSRPCIDAATSAAQFMVSVIHTDKPIWSTVREAIKSEDVAEAAAKSTALRRSIDRLLAALPEENVVPKQGATNTPKKRKA